MRITLAEGPITGLNTYPDNGIPEVSVGRGRVDFPLPLDCDPATIAPHFGRPVRVVLESVEENPPFVSTAAREHLRHLLDAWRMAIGDGTPECTELYQQCLVRLGGEG